MTFCLTDKVAIIAWAENSVVPLATPEDSQLRLTWKLADKPIREESTLLQLYFTFKKCRRYHSSYLEPRREKNIWFSILGDSCTLRYLHVKSKRFCSSFPPWFRVLTTGIYNLTIAANLSHAFNYTPLTIEFLGRYLRLSFLSRSKKIKWHLIREGRVYTRKCAEVQIEHPDLVFS